MFLQKQKPFINRFGVKFIKTEDYIIIIHPAIMFSVVLYNDWHINQKEKIRAALVRKLHDNNVVRNWDAAMIDYTMDEICPEDKLELFPMIDPKRGVWCKLKSMITSRKIISLKELNTLLRIKYYYDDIQSKLERHRQYDTRLSKKRSDEITAMAKSLRKDIRILINSKDLNVDILVDPFME